MNSDFFTDYLNQMVRGIFRTIVEVLPWYAYVRRTYGEVRGTDPERSEEISLLITKTRFHLQA